MFFIYFRLIKFFKIYGNKINNRVKAGEIDLVDNLVDLQPVVATNGTMNGTMPDVVNSTMAPIGGWFTGLPDLNINETDYEKPEYEKPDNGMNTTYDHDKDDYEKPDHGMHDDDKYDDGKYDDGKYDDEYEYASSASTMILSLTTFLFALFNY